MQIVELQLLTQFLELSGRPELDRTSWNRCLKTIQFLRGCDYAVEDVCSVLALASKYFQDLRARCTGRMSAEEAGHVTVVVVYIAHSYALDEYCPLSVWHRCLCHGYCAFGVMNAAVMHFMRVRGYILRVEDAELRPRFAALYTSVAVCRMRSS